MGVKKSLAAQKFNVNDYSHPFCDRAYIFFVVMKDFAELLLCDLRAVEDFIV